MVDPRRLSAATAHAGAIALTDEVVIINDPAGSPEVQVIPVADLLAPVTGADGYGIRMVSFELNGSTVLTTSDKGYFRVPSWMNGWNLIAVSGMCVGASSSGTPTFTLKNGVTSMLTTNITIDQGETDTSTAAAAAVIDTDHDGVATGNQIECACSVAGTGVTYSSVYATFQKP